MRNFDWPFLLFTLAIVGILINFLFKLQCPQCKAKFYFIKHLRTDDLGDDFVYPHKRIYRKYYQCRKCKHEWSIDQKRSDRSDID
ncbi:hypothetical protein [uncultured Aquimarina sp.]|uniref:hypothetical protein n=1 Tax=uncultured Aquimarina sp. TaxID=575652 RepID=UPI002610F489|nr:hypothetical protein [uncultured Aquimarina sp.]